MSAQHRVTPSIAATSSWSGQPRGISATTRPWNITRTRSQMRRSSSSSETISTPVPRSAAVLDGAEQGLLGAHVDARGRVDQHQQPAGRRPARGPSRPSAGCRRTGSPTGWSGPGGLDGEVARSALGRVASRRRRLRRGRTAPSRSGDGQGDVLRDRQQRDEALAVPVLRDEADAGARARRARCPAGPRAVDRRPCPHAARRRPTMVSATADLAAAAGAGQPDDLAGPRPRSRPSWKRPAERQPVDAAAPSPGAGGRGRSGPVAGQAGGLAGHRGDQLGVSAGRRPAR